MGVFIISPLPPVLLEELQTAGLLRSTDITPLPRYYEPIRPPLVVGRFPGVSGYTASLLRRFRAGTRRVLQLLDLPCHRAVANNPAEAARRISRLRRAMLPSPSRCGLGLRSFSTFGATTGSLALRPGDSLTILEDGFVNRLQDIQFPSCLLSSYGALDSYPGGTLTHWLMPAFTGRTHFRTDQISMGGSVILYSRKENFHETSEEDLVHEGSSHRGAIRR